MELRALELGWIKGREDDPADQCAHGKILFQVGNIIFARPEDGIWTVSAAGLFLLRTLEYDHTAMNPLSEFNFLIPHCGTDAWENKKVVWRRRSISHQRLGTYIPSPSG